MLTAVDGGCELRNTRLWILINNANTLSVDVCNEKTMQAGGEGAAKQHAKKRQGQGAVAGREGGREREGRGRREERGQHIWSTAAGEQQRAEQANNTKIMIKYNNTNTIIVK